MTDSEDSNLSHCTCSRNPSPVDDTTLDPDFTYRITDIEPRSVRTRQSERSEDSNGASNKLFSPIYKTQTII